MKLTLGQAAKAAGRSKGTLSKALTSGSMSAAKDEKGRWQIDPSELSRWMSANPVRNGFGGDVETDENIISNRGLDAEVEVLRERVENLTSERERERSQLLDQIEDLRKRLDGAETERARLSTLLTDQRGTPSERPRRGFLSRLFG